MASSTDKLLVLLDGSARSDDLLLRGAGDLVDRDVQFNRNVAVPEDFDLLVLADSPLATRSPMVTSPPWG